MSYHCVSERLAITTFFVMLVYSSSMLLGQTQPEFSGKAMDERAMVVNAVWAKFQRLDSVLMKRLEDKDRVTDPATQEVTDSANNPAVFDQWEHHRFEHLQALLSIVADSSDPAIAQQVIAAGRSVAEQQQLRNALARRFAELGEYALATEQLRDVPSSHDKVSTINQLCRMAGDFGPSAVVACQAFIREHMPQAGDILPDNPPGFGKGAEPPQPLTVAEADLLQEEAWTQLAISLAKTSSPMLDEIQAELHNETNQDLVQLERAVQAYIHQPFINGIPQTLDINLSQIPFKTTAAKNLAELIIVDDYFRQQSFTNLELKFDQAAPTARRLLRKAILLKIEILQQHEPEMARRFAVGLFDELVKAEEVMDDEDSDFWGSPEEEMVFAAGMDSAIYDCWQREGLNESISFDQILKAMVLTNVCRDGFEVLDQIREPSNRKQWIRSSLSHKNPKMSEMEIRQLAADFQKEFGTPLISDLEYRLFCNAIQKGDFLLAWNQFERQGGVEKRKSWASLLVLLDQSPERVQAVADLKATMLDQYLAQVANMSDSQAIDFLNMENLNLSVHVGRTGSFSISRHPFRDLLWEKACGMADIFDAYRKLSSILFSMTTFIDPQSPAMYEQLIEEFIQKRSIEIADTRHAQLLRLKWLLDKHRYRMPARGWSLINADVVPNSLADLVQEFPILADWSLYLKSLSPSEMQAFRVRNITQLLAWKHAASGDVRQTLVFIDSLPNQLEGFELLLEVSPQMIAPASMVKGD